MISKTKKCLPVSRGGCGMEYPLEDFHKEKGGRKPRCKLCHARWIQMTPEQKAPFLAENIGSRGKYRIVKDGSRGYRIRMNGEELRHAETREGAESIITMLERLDEIMGAFFSGQRPTRCDREYQSAGLVL